jgi:hypothetical protein
MDQLVDANIYKKRTVSILRDEAGHCVFSETLSFTWQSRRTLSSYILQCDGTRVWTDRWLERKFTGIHPETGIKKIASNKMRDN